MNIPGAPSPVKDEGNTLVIYRRQPGGAWKAWRDIFNSTLPAAGSPAEPKTGVGAYWSLQATSFARA